MSGARNTFVSKVVERFISCYYLEQMATLDPTLIPAQTSFNHLFAAGVFFAMTAPAVSRSASGVCPSTCEITLALQYAALAAHI